MAQERVIITVIGKDRVGIIAAVSTVLAELNVNIVDISQTLLQEFFTMIMIGDLSGSKTNIFDLQERLQRVGEEMGVKIFAQHEEVFNFMHRI